MRMRIMCSFVCRKFFKVWQLIIYWNIYLIRYPFQISIVPHPQLIPPFEHYLFAQNYKNMIGEMHQLVL